MLTGLQEEITSRTDLATASKESLAERIWSGCPVIYTVPLFSDPEQDGQE